MTAQSLAAAPVPALADRPASSSPPAHGACAACSSFGGAILLTAAATREMVLVLGVNGITPLAYGILALFVSLFAWIALALTSSDRRLRQSVLALAAGAGLDTAGAPPAAAYRAADAGLQRERRRASWPRSRRCRPISSAAGRRQPVRPVHPQRHPRPPPPGWPKRPPSFGCARASGMPAMFYRRRAQNTERKAGNIADWVRRWGGAYDAVPDPRRRQRHDRPTA